MLSEKNLTILEQVAGPAAVKYREHFRPRPETLEALMNAARHQAQEEAKAVCVEGWKLVPVEPTEAMVEAAKNTPGMTAVGEMVLRAFARGDVLPAPGEAGSPLEQAFRAMIAAAPQPPNQVEEASQGSGQRACGSRVDQAVGATAALASDWVTMNRTKMIDTFRSWADKQMSIHEAKDSGLALSQRDAAFYRADALFEVAATIEEGEFDPVRPADGFPGATASTTHDTGTEKVAAQVEDEGSRDALNPLPTQHTRDRIAELEEAARALAEYVALNAMDRMITEDGVVVGWEKTPDFSKLINRVRDQFALNTKDKEGAE